MKKERRRPQRKINLGNCLENAKDSLRKMEENGKWAKRRKIWKKKRRERKKVCDYNGQLS